MVYCRLPHTGNATRLKGGSFCLQWVSSQTVSQLFAVVVPCCCRRKGPDFPLTFTKTLARLNRFWEFDSATRPRRKRRKRRRRPNRRRQRLHQLWQCQAGKMHGKQHIPKQTSQMRKQVLLVVSTCLLRAVRPRVNCFDVCVSTPGQRVSFDHSNQAGAGRGLTGLFLA